MLFLTSVKKKLYLLKNVSETLTIIVTKDAKKFSVNLLISIQKYTYEKQNGSLTDCVIIITKVFAHS